MPIAPTVAPMGEAALLVTLGSAVEVRLARRAQALASAVRELRSADPRWGPSVPGAATVLVRFDPLTLDRDEAAETLRVLAGRVPDADPASSEGRLHEIAVRYGGDEGPDIDAVAAEAGLRPADVVDLHQGVTYEVAFLGFAPGFAYLLTVPPRIARPRLATPRPRVPAGSVGIAGPATGVYPAALPGGWRVIGRSDARLFEPAAPDPALLRPGDRVRFVPA